MIYFQGVTVYAPSYVLNQSEIVIMFQSGAGLEVLENKGFMTTRVYLPWQFIVNINYDCNVVVVKLIFILYYTHRIEPEDCLATGVSIKPTILLYPMA